MNLFHKYHSTTISSTQFACETSCVCNIKFNKFYIFYSKKKFSI